MRTLIADDDDVCRLELKVLPDRNGHEVVAVWDEVRASRPGSATSRTFAGKPAHWPRKVNGGTHD